MALSVSKDNEIVSGSDKWVLMITRNMSFWHGCLSNEGSYFHTSDFGIDFKLRLLTFVVDSTRSSLFFEKQNMEQGYQAIWVAINTEDGLLSLKNFYRQFAEELLVSLGNYITDLRPETYQQFMDSYSRLTAGLNITALIGRHTTDLINARLKELGYKDEEIPDIVATVTYPREHTPLFDSQLALLEIGARIQDGSLKQNEIDKELAKWLEAYGVIPVNFCEEPWSIEDARTQLTSMLEKKCKEELAISNKLHEDHIQNARAKLEEINDPRLTTIARALQEITTMNEFRKNVFCRVSLGYRPIFSKIADIAGLSSWRDCFYLTPEETLNIVKGEKLKANQLIQERRVVGTVVGENGDVKFMDSDDLAVLENYIKSVYSNSEQSAGQKIIKGMPACKGKVTGIAKVVLGSKDFHKLRPGEILVAPMTSVDYVSVMERAAAFITNEGGITSHASIVAREMNKPCIIGTKMATQLIADGDMVEVDADRGVVTIL